MVKNPFKKASYLAQVRRLRALAQVALVQYQIRVKSIHFINHGENTTFRVLATNSQTYLLRIHRNDYHTKAAITEEMAWLSRLARKGLSVPDPVRSISGKLVETSEYADLQRHCSVFKWIPGKFIEKSLKPRHMFEIGQLLADFQNNTPKGKTKNRNYWSAEGLAGSNPTFGSLDQLAAVTSKQQKTLTSARKLTYRKLKHFEKKHPERMGLIHADLHFGNIISTPKGLGAIDFDDCGHGFFAYDLIVPYLSMQYSLGKKRKRLFPEYRQALIDGYKTKRDWDSEDDAIFWHLVTARKLLMLGWLNSRSDNPRLKKYMKGAVKRALLHLSSPSN